MTTSKERTIFKPRFDFGSNHDPSGEQTGTIKELLEELNYEKFRTTAGADAKKSDSKVVRVDLKSLRGSLEFLNKAIGTVTPKITQRVPLSTLKSIKLLYVTNDTSDKHLFKLLKSPLKGGRATLEFYTTEAPTRNHTGNSIVNNLLSALRKEVDPVALRAMDTSFLTYSKLLDCIAKENIEILQPIYARHGGHPISIAKAFSNLANSVKQYEQELQELERPVHEKLYTYIRALPLLHFIREDQYINKLAHIKKHINPIPNEIDQFCSGIENTQHTTIGYDTPVLSIKSFPAFVESNTKELGRLIEQATGIRSDKRDLLKIVNASSKVLCVYVLHEWHRVPLDTINLSIADCVAALCTIRHQQKIKTKYSDYWPGQKQSERGTSVLRQMDDSRGPEELFEHDYIPHGINLLLFHRFSQFYMGITDNSDRYSAWKNLEAERFNKYVECYLSNSVFASDHAVTRFYLYCRSAAFQAAALTPVE